MRRALRSLALLLMLPAALAAQSVIAIPPQQCVWRAGDNAAWAAPNLDESGWQPYSTWDPSPAESRIWVRCHADLSALRAMSSPAIQIRLYAAYQLFAGGTLIGAAGNLRTGRFSMNAVRQYRLPAAGLQAKSTAIALRICYRYFAAYPGVLLGKPPSAEMDAGDFEELAALRAQAALAGGAAHLVDTACFAAIAVVGLMLLGLFYYDRSRPELLYLSVYCVSLAVLRVREFSAATLMNLSSATNLELFAVLNAIVPLAATLFYFSLAKRRVFLIYWLAVAIAVADFALLGITELLPASQALRLFGVLTNGLQSSNLTTIAELGIATSGFAAFWPYGKISGRMRPLAALCLVSNATQVVWFAAELAANPAWGRSSVFAHLHPDLLAARAFVTACVLAALLALLFRDQQRTAHERTELAGEMQAASEIQRMLAPARLDAARGLQIDVAFRPMRDVGGDFYQCRVLADGRQRILLGDVSGKGTAAAMAATLLLGAAAARDSDSPAALLTHLDRVLGENRLGGFATCLCADVSAHGEVTIANAGHLAPYCNGKEIPIPSGLPVGVNQPHADGYEERVFRLEPGERLTFLSDGVVEARNGRGELFGFERAAKLSTQPAENVAQAAQTFGQEDDITVLTLSFAPAEVEHA